MEQAGFLAKKTYEILNGLGQMNIPEKEACCWIDITYRKKRCNENIGFINRCSTKA